MNQVVPAEATSFRRQVRQAWRRLRGGKLSPRRAALSVAVGLLIGATPFYGFQLLLILAICIPLRLDTPVAYITAHFSNPLTFPLIVGVEIEIGSLLLTGKHATFSWDHAETIGFEGYALQLAVGAPVLGTVLATVGGAVTLLVSRRRAGSTDPLAAAVERTAQRYRQASRRDRFYVRGKLDGDPALRALTSLAGDFGRVVDAGCGLGQVGLCLHELGRTTALSGFDTDQRAILVAQQAAGDDARFAISDFASAAWGPADTILFIDSLHYVDASSQDAALQRAVQNLRAGGRLIIRDVNQRARWRSWLTRWLERLAVVLKIRKASRITFRPVGELIGHLESCGLACTVVPPAEWSPFENVLIVATKAAPGCTSAPATHAAES